MMEERVAQSVPLASAPEVRDVVFLSKATPGDDEFALWLAPKLEAAGYKVFTDIRTLEPGDRWRNVITSTLQNQASKMLLCCSNETLAAAGVQEEIEIGLDLAKELNDPRFVIPLRIRPYKKLFGIGGLQYIDFVCGWAEGLEKLLETLKRQKVPVRADGAIIQPSWELYRRRGAVALKEEPERLTSNWLRISEAPDIINYFEASGVIDRDALAKIAPKSPYPVALMQSGFVTFQSADEVAAKAIDAATRIVNLHEAVKKVVKLYADKTRKHRENDERSVDLWILVVPEIIFERCKPNSRRIGLPKELGNFEKRKKTRSDLPLLKEVLTEEDLFDDAPDFHRQVKAEYLTLSPTQILRETTLAPEEFKNKAG